MNTALASMPSDLKEENRKAVLYSFHDSGMLTAAEVAEKTGISRQTVKKCIEYYTGSGLLHSCGKGSSSQVGGKRPELFTLNDDVRMVSILLHHHEVIVDVIDLHYNKVAHWSSGFVHIPGMDAMWRMIEQGVLEVLPSTTRDWVVGVSFAVPLGHNSAEQLTVATPFPDWPHSDYGRSMRTPLEALFPMAHNIIIISDGSAAGSAMLYHDFATYASGDLVTLYCATGVGGALFRSGRLGFGEKQMISAFGHIIVAPDDPDLCGCGSHGCLERMVNRKRMRERLATQNDLYKKSILANIPVESVTFAQLFEGSGQGDLLCRRESCYFARMFAIALRNLVLAIDPEFVVFQGDFGLADEVFRQELLNKLFEFKYLDPEHNISIRYDSCDLSEEETLGATYQLICHYLAHPEQYKK